MTYAAVKKESSAMPLHTEPDSMITMNTQKGTILIGLHFNHKAKDTLQTKVERLMTEELMSKNFA